MKRVIPLILVVVFCFSLCACRGEEEPSYDDIISAVQWKIPGAVFAHTGYLAKQGNMPSVSNNYINEIDEFHYEVTGSYFYAGLMGKYEADVTYDPLTKEFDVDLDLY